MRHALATLSPRSYRALGMVVVILLALSFSRFSNDILETESRLCYVIFQVLTLPFQVRQLSGSNRISLNSLACAPLLGTTHITFSRALLSLLLPGLYMFVSTGRGPLTWAESEKYHPFSWFGSQHDVVVPSYSCCCCVCVGAVCHRNRQHYSEYSGTDGHTQSAV